jgi:hypothetical protein
MLIINKLFKKQRKDTKTQGNLKVLEDKFSHPCIEMKGRVSAINTVVLVRIKLHLELFVGLYQGLCKIHGVLVVYIVIPILEVPSPLHMQRLVM